MTDPNVTRRDNMAAAARRLAELGETNGWPPALIELLRRTGAASGPAAGDPSEPPSDPAAPRIVVVSNGPLLADEVPEITDHLGCSLDLGGPALLCRCGNSEIKPCCDASCLRDGFDDAKDPERVPDRRDTHVGLQVTVLDNRGICQHSGLCTDRLANVFHTDGEPFVTASGGRLDEIIRAVRDCPSGALSYAIDGIEARDQVDWGHTRPPAVEVSHDGPYRVTGPVELVDGEGVSIPRAAGASREHYALCRCGHSRNKPFCSGMHYYVEFRDPVPAGDTIPSVFEWAGGLPALTRMTRIFYERYVPADDLLAPVFAGMSADHPQRVARWLAEVFGGPALYSAPYGGYHRMISEHRGRQLTEEQRARWVELLTRSARDAGLPNDAEFRSAFGSYLEWGSRLAVENSQTDARPPQNMPMPRWDWSTAAGPPGSRISALDPTGPAAAPPAETVHLPGPDEPVSFAAHIQPLFRDRDRRSMLFAFDLWDYDQVREHGEAIAERLRAGTMPCDGPWPADRVDVFTRWFAGDAAP
jgi:CDGSH-type Zn-finger protein/truncated hemoglobin YjbI